ncbi:hypothetical protein GP486_005673 [Trichoglossum hirsutum]|uniref:Zn(2)-C6 fungal-type domain-containing protein n=1 Tax=Trichoglossum hirsutum TaxID=265104 RepID=A0A9P8RLT6_9PEZI|nr:hypothetical protein GP486_005673 [Trichoglossum hirsutum]
MAHHPDLQPACLITVHTPVPVHPNTPNPFRRQATQGLAPRKSNADMGGMFADSIMVVLGGLGKNGASVETLSRHPALREPDHWLQEFAYIYKTGWLDSEESQVPSTEVHVVPKKEPQTEEKIVQDSPMVSSLPDTYDLDSDSDSDSVRLDRKPFRFVSMKARKLSAWKARQLDASCRHCRDQHSMCDRMLPSCTACRDADLHCSYGPALTRDQRCRLPTNDNIDKFDVDAAVLKLKSWLQSRTHQHSPSPDGDEGVERKLSISSRFDRLVASAKRLRSPKSLSAVVGRSRGSSDADRRGVVREVLGPARGGEVAPATTCGIGDADRSPAKSQAATLVRSDSQSVPLSPAAAQSRSSSDRRSSITRSGSFEKTTTAALLRAADEVKNAPPDCPPRPFQCTFCLRQCLTQPVWQRHEESHQRTLEPQPHRHRHRSSPTNSSTTSTDPWSWNCGFCHKTLATWAERVDHIGEHYANRLTMASWDPLTSPHPFDKTSLTYVSGSPRWSMVKLLVAQRPELFNHITRTGETEKLFRCRFCDTRYRTWEEFECHHELWHRRHYTWSCPTVDDLKERLLQDQQQQQEHQQEPQPPAAPPNDAADHTNPTPTLCPCCSTPTPARYLPTHLATVHNFAACTRHGVRFTTERHFRMHLANRHGFHEGATYGDAFVDACKKVEPPLEVERREVVRRR